MHNKMFNILYTLAKDEKWKRTAWKVTGEGGRGTETDRRGVRLLYLDRVHVGD